MANSSVQMVIEGLNSMQTSVPNAGKYLVTCKMNLPTLSKGDPANSQVVAVVSQQGSPVYTSVAGTEGFQISLNCAADDVILVSLSSAAAIDQGLNVIKTVVAIG